MNTPVNFEIAKLLKEKGIYIETLKAYYTHGDTQLLLWFGPEYWNNQEDFLCHAPTIAEVVMWIHEKHNIWITVERYLDPEESEDFRFGSSIYYIDDYFGRGHKTPTEAYEASIIYTLNHLI